MGIGLGVFDYQDWRIGENFDSDIAKSVVSEFLGRSVVGEHNRGVDVISIFYHLIIIVV